MGQGYIFYPPNPQRDQGKPLTYESLMRMDPHKHWCLHSYNEVALKHISDNTKDAREKVLAEHEILIAVRKQRWWETHPNFDALVAAQRFKREYRLDKTPRQQNQRRA